ncbi:hypothetical protein Thu_238 [Bacillus phage Thurquoise]|uniref:Uncharacterized protein n=1 Tax=Bacillus phage Deep Blue TaxID=1792245 RepID=A0A140HLK4_9CAUD|nr:membrane protein [Bacillus phage Deep Blue]AMO25866.1 hypothetical protein Blue_043 [Bacillus phage Deep Blue]UXQ89081.1 hypothetical protein Thu_238 [Bacillus phage Thurquoise]
MSDKAVTWLMDRADKLGSFIDELAKQLGVAATHVYEVLVKQQYVEGIGLLVKAGITIAILLFMWYLLNKFLIKNYAVIEEDYDFGFLVWIIGAILAVVTFFTILFVVGDITLGIKKLLNPEYYALETLMDFMKDQGAKK